MSSFVWKFNELRWRCRVHSAHTLRHRLFAGNGEQLRPNVFLCWTSRCKPYLSGQSARLSSDVSLSGSVVSLCGYVEIESAAEMSQSGNVYNLLGRRATRYLGNSEFRSLVNAEVLVTLFFHCRCFSLPFWCLLVLLKMYGSRIVGGGGELVA